MSDTNKKPDNPLNVDGVGESQEARQADLAPETHNDEQDDHRAQAQEIAQLQGSATRLTVAAVGDRARGGNAHGARAPVGGDDRGGTGRHLRGRQ